MPPKTFQKVFTTVFKNQSHFIFKCPVIMIIMIIMKIVMIITIRMIIIMIIKILIMIVTVMEDIGPMFFRNKRRASRVLTCLV